MQRTLLARGAAAVALAAALPLALSGCDSLDLLQHQVSGTAASTRALELAWRTPASEPEWIPADATRIRYVAATGGAADASPATVRADTSSGLPASCAVIERRSLDSFGPTWAPRAFPDRVERCGNWAVMWVDGGWFGWTPLAPSERTAKPVG